MLELDTLQDLDTEEESNEFHVETLPHDASDRAIERFFERGRLRVVQDRNDFFLPHVVDFIEGRKWGNLKPEYQRRLRWDDRKKSKLIESFIMNVPVPPVFLYEQEIGRFEVMDGQQRLNTIVEFMQNRFKLSGLKTWHVLNGRSFSQLPPRIKRGLERAKVSAITLMSDVSDTSDNNLDLRAQVFERLNTGGERLNPQELRNSLFSGPFNQLIIKLSRNPLFTQAWNIPSYEENILSDGSPTDKLKRNRFFNRMTDVEIVLRFFAFKEPDKILGSVRSMLDNTMIRYRNSKDDELEQLRNKFLEAIDLCVEVFGDDVFRIPPGDQRTKPLLSRPFFDAQMVVMYQFASQRNRILKRADSIKKAVLDLAALDRDSYELIVGRANTAATVRGRIEVVRTVIEKVLK